MRNKKILTAIVTLFMMGQISWADGDVKKGKGRFKQLIQELQLSKEQISKIKDHRKSMKGKMKPLREQVKQLRGELDKAFLNGGSDGEMKSLNTRILDTRTQINEIRFSKMVFFKNVLNQEQRQTFIEKKKKYKGKRGWRK